MITDDIVNPQDGEKIERYQIHDNPNDTTQYKGVSVQLQAYTHLKRWIKAYNDNINGNLLDDYLLFPHITMHKISPDVKSTENINLVLKAICTFTSTKHKITAIMDKQYVKFTSHAFRRGGAQYRFFYAPVKLTITQSLYWGGWAKGDRNPDTLLRYLLNEYSALNEDMSDLLSPYRHDMNVSPIQDTSPEYEARENKARLLALTASTEEMKSMLQNIQSQLNERRLIRPPALDEDNQLAEEPFEIPTFESNSNIQYRLKKADNVYTHWLHWNVGSEAPYPTLGPLRTNAAEWDTLAKKMEEYDLKNPCQKGTRNSTKRKRSRDYEELVEQSSNHNKSSLKFLFGNNYCNICFNNVGQLRRKITAIGQGIDTHANGNIDDFISDVKREYGIEKSFPNLKRIESYIKLENAEV